jgi:RND family efflux transporter MFP subunit
VKKFIVVLLILLAAGLTGFKLYSNKLVIEAKTNMKGDVDIFPVYAAEAALHPYSESVVFSGVLKADEEVSVYSEKMGTVTKKYKKAGDTVSKGELIALVDNSLEQELLQIAKLNLETAKTELDRAKKLLDSNAIAPTRYESTLVAYRQAQSSVADISKQVEKSYIRSPLTGVIDNDYFEEGAFFGVGTPVADIVSTAGLKMTARISEEEVIKLKIGDKAEMYADVLPGLKFTGKISRIGTNANKSFNYTVEIAVDNPAVLYKTSAVKPGMYAKGVVQTYEASILMVPKSAVLTEAGADLLMLLEDNKAASRPVKTGRRDDNFIEITSGLTAGEVVISSGQINLRDGTPARRVTE